MFVAIALKAIKLLATYFANPADKDKVVAKLNSLSTSEPDAYSDKTFLFVYASMCMFDDNIKEALRIISQASPLGIEL
jgi:hypothetical protein